jgi:hypothetical protein
VSDLCEKLSAEARAEAERILSAAAKRLLAEKLAEKAAA